MAHTKPKIIFSHDQVGDLTIDNGIDDVSWTYGLNTQTFPTYGGEVVQVLSVYIDDLTLLGTCATYEQMETIYQYFVSYLQVASQGLGKNASPNVGDNTLGRSYNLYPVHFIYPERGWYFHLYPKNVPGFHYGTDVVTPTWQVSCHVVDDTPDIEAIKNGIAALHVSNTSVPPGATPDQGQNFADTALFTINGEISPQYGDPNADPFETFNTAPALTQIQKYADFYNALIPKWMSGDLTSLVAGIGSQPNFIPSTTTSSPGLNVPSPPTQTQSGGVHKPGAKNPTSTTNLKGGPSTTLPSHNADYQTAFNKAWTLLKTNYDEGGCAAISNLFFLDPSLVNYTGMNAIEKQATQDAINSFARAPFHCPIKAPA